MPPHLTLVSSTTQPARRAQRQKLPKPPAHMTAEGKQAWAHIVPIAARKADVGAPEVFALERLCETYGDIVRATESLSRPFVIVTHQGDLAELAPAGGRFYETHTRKGIKRRERPECAAIRRAEKQLKAWLAEFCLTPADIASGPEASAGSVGTGKNNVRESAPQAFSEVEGG